MNIGLVAWKDGQIASLFVSDWRRARAFGREDISFLQEFVREIDSSTTFKKQLTLGPSTIDADKLEAIVGEWGNSIQFSEPKSSLRLPEQVIQDVASIYLTEFPRRAQKGRDRRVAAKLALQSVKSVLREERGPSAGELVKRRYRVDGKVDEHFFDVAVANGRLFFAAQGISFENSVARNMDKEIDATAWAIDDVKKVHGKLPVAVLALAPQRSFAGVQKAKKIFEGLGADVVSEGQMDKWVLGRVHSLPSVASLLGRRGG